MMDENICFDESMNIEGYTLDDFRFLVGLNMKLQRGFHQAGVFVDVKIEEIEDLCFLVERKIMSEPLLLELSVPITVVGDLHGQYYDLMRIFRKLGFPSEHKYLFLGDYVDRGPQSVETIALLFTYKAMFPENIYLLRGNHESKRVCSMYGLQAEMKDRFGEKRAYLNFCSVFNVMPIAAVLDNCIFCTHGGLSRQLMETEITDIREIFRDIQRPIELCPHTLPYDLLWTDPADSECGSPEGWVPSTRGPNVERFGHSVINEFLQKFDMKKILRGHEHKAEGYHYHCHGKLITIFSAPNYCNKYGNKACVLVLKLSENGDIQEGPTIFEPSSIVYSIPFRNAKKRKFVILHSDESITL